MFQNVFLELYIEQVLVVNLIKSYLQTTSRISGTHFEQYLNDILDIERDPKEILEATEYLLKINSIKRMQIVWHIKMKNTYVNEKNGPL